MKQSRRRFLRFAILGVLAVALASLPALTVSTLSSLRRRVHTHGVPLGRPRDWVFVVDLRKCDGCGVCTRACQEFHYLPKAEPNDGSSIRYGRQAWIPLYELKLQGGNGTYFLPRPCMQCENAPCVNVCPVGACYYNEDNLAVTDARVCIGCRLCVAACPYDALAFNWGDPDQPSEAYKHEYCPEFGAPHTRGTVSKCMFCATLTPNNEIPVCAASCPNKAIYFGDKGEDIVTNGVEVVRFSKLVGEGQAFRLKEHLGTEPRVYYVPGYGQLVGRKPTDPPKDPYGLKKEAPSQLGAPKGG